MAKKKSNKKKKKRSRLGKILIAFFKVTLSLVIMAGIGCTAYYAYTVSTCEKIDPKEIYSYVEKTSYLYDANGKEIDRLYYTEDRELLDSSEIPEITKNAFIAVEDKTFYKHHGFNYKRMIGAVLYKVLGQSDKISGTSTITQQLARNVYLPDIKGERTISRKIKEMHYAHVIEKALTKDEILEAYLNTIYLGYGCYGLDSAARTYFSKDASELGLVESAALAALPQAPDVYALLQNEEGEYTKYLKKYHVYANDASKERRDLVLSLMAEQGYITDEEAKEADVEIKNYLKPDFGKSTNKYTYFTDYVTQVVAKDLADVLNITDEQADLMVHTGGLHIFSTIDPDIQKIVNDEFSDDWNFPWSSEDPQAAMVITEVGTGKIIAMVGGRGASGKQLFNRATSPRQPGSSIKPLSVYSAALQKSFEYEAEGKTFPFTDFGIDKQGTSGWGDYITASSQVTDEKMVISGSVWPLNFTRSYSGYKNFRTALQQSVNTCAVKIQMQVGTEYSMEMLKKFGITTAVDDTSLSVNDMNPAALALGAMAYGVTPLEMALAYGAFPGGGVRCEPRCYDKVTDSEGNILLEAETKGERVMDEGVAFIMTDVLKSVVSKGIASAASLYGVQVGGKTGTTNDTYDIWFCGFTPKYSAALWIGTDHNTAMSTTSNTAAALWSEIMRQVPDVTEGEYPSQPSNVISRFGEYFTNGTEPSSNPFYKPKKSKSSSGSKRSSSSPSDDGGNHKWKHPSTGTYEFSPDD